MRILLVSPHGDGVWFVHLLEKAGHQVDWLTTSEKDVDTLSGIVGPPLSKPPDPAKYELIIYDSSGMGESADHARAVTPVIGSSQLADALEHDRIFGIESMENAGIPVPPWESFPAPAAAISWLKKNPVRTVLKPVGDAPADATYVSHSSEDMIHYIETRLHKKVKAFVLQQYISGTEVSTEAWWTGTQWVALSHTLEEKKFMNGGVGPNTGCAGSVVWMPTKNTPLFEQGLKKIEPLLKESNFVGMIDLNTIVTEGNLFGLEWTPRFGYEAACNLTRLLPMEFGEFLSRVAIGDTFSLTQPKANFSATVRTSVPPYPSAEFSRRKDQVPICGINCDELDKFVLYDVMANDKGELMTGGHYQAIGSPIGVGESIEDAFEEVMNGIKQLDVPNLQYRTDVESCVRGRYNDLRAWGWLRSIG